MPTLMTVPVTNELYDCAKTRTWLASEAARIALHGIKTAIVHGENNPTRIMLVKYVEDKNAQPL